MGISLGRPQVIPVLNPSFALKSNPVLSSKITLQEVNKGYDFRKSIKISFSNGDDIQFGTFLKVKEIELVVHSSVEPEKHHVFYEL